MLTNPRHRRRRRLLRAGALAARVFYAAFAFVAGALLLATLQGQMFEGLTGAAAWVPAVGTLLIALAVGVTAFRGTGRGRG